jgi:peptidyl-prolyl cis-trans isomerase C
MRREPLVHFILLGTALFGLYRWVGPRPRDRIVLTPSFVAGLREEARARTGRLPTPAEEQTLIDRFVDEEMLYREALTLGLDRGDVIVRRRLVQKMEQLTRRTPGEPDEAELRRYLELHRDRYDVPERLTLHHVFSQGKPFLAGDRFVGKSQAELAGIFGADAARAMMAMPEGQWTPVRSRYGEHLVFVEEHRPARAATADERVRNDWLEERRSHPDPEALAQLRAHYTVERP